MAEHASQSHGFSGPRCWVVTAFLGLLLGAMVAFVVPGKPAAHDSGHAGAGHANEDAATVRQIDPDGTRVELLPDGTIRPLTGDQPAEAKPPTAIDSAPQPAPALPTPESAAHPEIPLWLCAPFALLLISIAAMPFISVRFWHAHYPDFAFLLGGFMLSYYLVAFGSHGRHEMVHVGMEYYSFIALIGGLYVASGGVLIDVRSRASPLKNTLLLAVGAILANILGTTGASVLLIRPFMRMNRGRMRPIHAVFFIFIVSNCAGSLTPIGDPPLYLGYLKGVPFFWTLSHLWPMWLLTNGVLLAMFFVVDGRMPKCGEPGTEGHPVFDPGHRTPLIDCSTSLIGLSLIVGGVFIDPLLKTYANIEGYPIGATFQIIVAALTYAMARPSIRHANQFTFEPVKEVGFLFIGIFLTMAPALGYLRGHAGELGLESPSQYYFLTGSLSAVLDNAPTYLSFLQVALGTLHVPLDAEGVREFIQSTYEVSRVDPVSLATLKGELLLKAISLGAVFFGAMTYIGNGPNFMVKSIVDAAYATGHAPGAAPGQATLGTRMPSFFGYVGYALLILLPVLLLNWLVFIR